RALLARRLLRQHVRQQGHRFDVDALPADVGNRHNGDAIGRQLFKSCNIAVAGGDDDSRPYRCDRKRKVARRSAAGDLQIDNAVSDTIAAHGFAQDDAERSKRHRLRHSQFTQRAVQPGKMAALIDELAAFYLTDLIVAVGELIAAILDRDLRARMRKIATVDIGDERHGRPYSLRLILTGNRYLFLGTMRYPI